MPTRHPSGDFTVVRGTYLVSMAKALAGQEDGFSIFLKAYYELVHARALYECTDGFEAAGRAIFKLQAKEGWYSSMDLLTRHATVTGLVGPTFNAIWAEVLDFLHMNRNFNDQELSVEDYRWLIEEEEYFGTSHEKITVLISEELRVAFKIYQWFKSFLQTQPKYIDRPANISEQIDARTTDKSSILLGLDRAIEASQKHYHAIHSVIGFFGNLVLTAANYVCSQYPEVNQELNDSDIDKLVETLGSLVVNPFSGWPVVARQQGARMNVQGTFGLLLQDAANLANDTHRLSELQWRMFHHFVLGLHQTAVAHNCEKLVGEALGTYKLEQFFDADALPVAGWVCDAFDDILQPGYDYDYEASDLDFDLPDDIFEPSGPELKAEQYATAVSTTSALQEEDCSICRDTLNIYATARDEVPVKICCGHCFHYGCLNTLINGISNFSNTCPNCRQAICPPRDKRLKDDNTADQGLDSSAVLSEVESDSVENGSELRDKEGDVVMTDD